MARVPDVSNVPATKMRLGLVQCGHVHPDVARTTGDYPALFTGLLDGHDVELTTYLAVDGELPLSPAEQDGWIISGSANSTYDDEPWIALTQQFLRDVVEAEAPMVAVCFGHQLLAQALGSTVAKSPNGWGVGLHTYQLIGDPRSWMDPPLGAELHLLASHQDQVQALPHGAELLATSPHCPIAAYSIGSTALAIQPHPEFTPLVSKGLLEIRRPIIGDEIVDAAEASLASEPDNEAFGNWMISFLREAIRSDRP